MNYDVFGMCNPLYDIQAEIPESLLQTLGLQKGGMFLIDEEQQQALVAQVYSHIVNAESGGSGANTMIGIALLGGKACYTGKVGRDEHGTLYANKLREKAVTLCTEAGEGTTGICVVLITPDTERTLCTYLGICRELGPDDVDLDALRASKYLYVTGYLWDTETQKAAVLKAMREAKAAGVKVALSLSDPFCVHRHKADFLQIVREHVDLLIGNHEEAQALMDVETPHEAIRALQPYCDLAAVTLGAQGALLRAGDTVLEIPVVQVQPVDTTGAGDMYAAGLLYGLTHGLPLERTGHLAAEMAAQVVAKLGPRLEEFESALLA
ncbi:MAG TPA: adenosine kinase [Chthonomonadaceae bacterium]|nr:adenosine kinase [Chthonomonadaceae bacterium]